ncbi:MAG: response regulator [Planctomycetota bacterium]|nr:response regulator [Planctomycetota bacterium]
MRSRFGRGRVVARSHILTSIVSHAVTVLLVDDQRIIGEAVRRMLVNEKDIAFHYCGDPAAAQQTAAQVSPTVMLVDLVMPGIDGLSLVRGFRENPETRMIPIIVLSTTEDAKVKANAFSQGANDYIVKLPDPLELIARIRHHSAGYINLLDKNEAFRALLESQQALEVAKDQAEKATRAKSDFLACMSHDIRTPMNAIIGMTDVLLESELNAEQRTHLRVVRSAGETLLHLINSILDFSKIEAGELRLEKIAFNLREVVNDSVDITRVRAREKGLAINTEIEDEVPQSMLGDPTRLRQILINLISNAIKFTHQGEVRVKIARDKTTEPCALVFSVEDTGIGIPADKQASLFQKFMQVDSSTTRKYGGTGLGLAICRQLVELMGGRIWLESELGKGSTFRFRITAEIPKTSEPAQAQKPAANVPAAEVPPLQILLADDTPENRLLIMTYLKKTPHTLEMAVNGQLALDLYTKHAFDLVLMDMQMPVMDGYEATREIRKWELERGIAPKPIVALTAEAMAEDARRTAEAGCTEHVIKPIRKATLLDLIARYAPAPK